MNTTTSDIIVNGKGETLSSSTALNAWLNEHDYDFETGGFAIAINHHFIPRSQYIEIQLKPGDSVEIVAPMQGG